MKRVFEETSVSYVPLGKKVKLYDHLVAYGMADVTCLPTLYRCVDELTKEYLNANVTQFLTAGSIAWFGAVTHLPEECYEEKKNSKHWNKLKKNVLDTKLYRLEKS